MNSDFSSNSLNKSIFTLYIRFLIVFLDSNKITLDNELNVSSNEDLKKRFLSINFNVIEAVDDVESIDNAMANAFHPK